jgi:hypothetical protein
LAISGRCDRRPAISLGVGLDTPGAEARALKNRASHHLSASPP